MNNRIKLLFLVMIVITSPCLAQTKCDSTAFHEAVKFQQKGQFDSAMIKYSEQIKSCPTFSKSYRNRGFLYFGKHQLDKALEDFSSAVDVSADKIGTQIYIADTYFNMQTYIMAYILYQKAVLMDDTNSKAYFKMGRSLWLNRIRILQENKVEDYAQDTAFKTHLKSEILNLYDKAIYLDSLQNQEKYSKRGLNSMEAFQDLNTNSDYYFFRGVLKSNFGDYTGALKDYEQSNIVHPTVSGYEYAAYLAKKVGENKKACDYIQIWATLTNPTEKIDPFKKHEIADKFCKELGIEKNKL